MLYSCWLPTQEALLLLLQEERKGAGKSQKGSDVDYEMPCSLDELCKTFC